MSVKGQRSHNNRPGDHHDSPRHDGGEINVDDIRNSGVQHEEADVNVGPVYKFLGWLAVGVIFTYALVYGMMKWNDHRAEQENAQYTHVAKLRGDRLPPEPRLQLAPGHTQHPLDEGYAYRDSMNRTLNSYAYINKAAGQVRLSIDRAKEVLLQKGLPVRSGTTMTSETTDLTPQFTNGGRTYIARDQRVPHTSTPLPEQSAHAE